jgi:hypothetical protein
VRRKKGGKAPAGESTLSEHDKLAEQVIAALRFLADECRRAGLPEYGEIVSDGFDRCLNLYVSQQRASLAERISASDDNPKSGLN